MEYVAQVRMFLVSQRRLFAALLRVSRCRVRVKVVSSISRQSRLPSQNIKDFEALQLSIFSEFLGEVSLAAGFAFPNSNCHALLPKPARQRVHLFDDDVVRLNIRYVRWNCRSYQEIAGSLYFIKHSVIEQTPVAGPIGYGSRSESIAIKRQDDTALKR